MVESWIVVQFGGPELADCSFRGLTFEEATERMEQLRDAGAHGMMSPEPRQSGPGRTIGTGARSVPE